MRGLVLLAASLGQETCLAQVHVDTLQTTIPVEIQILVEQRYTLKNLTVFQFSVKLVVLSDEVNKVSIWGRK